MFDTYGPFVLRSHDKASLDDLFTQVEKANPTLKQAMGVYVVSGFRWNRIDDPLVRGPNP